MMHRRGRCRIRRAPEALLSGTFCLTLLLISLVGCGSREHENPLDPENPDTGGEPQWLIATADDGAVDLTWRVPVYDDLDAVRLIDVANDVVIWTGGDGRKLYRDPGLANGVTRTYRLDLVLNSGTIIDLPVERATPGTNIPWVYDVGRGEVVRMSPDGLRRRTGYFDPAALAVVAHPDSGFVLVLDFFSGSILELDREARERWVKDDYGRPNAGDYVRGGWWVSDSEQRVVRRLDESGTVVREFTDFSFPFDVVAVGDSAAWVADATGSVTRLHLNGEALVVDSLLSPRILAPTPDGGVWVADRDAAEIVRISASGHVLRRVAGYPGIEALAGDPISGGVWVGDRARRSVTLLDDQGQVVVSTLGFPTPSSLSVSPDGSEVWVADPTLGDLVRLSRSGEIIERSLDLSSPASVSVAFR